MPKEKTELIRKDSAVMSTALVNLPVASLLSSDVPVGQWLFGFDPMSADGPGWIMKSDDEPSREWSQHTTEPFLLRAWIARKVLLPATEERDERQVVRLVLIDPQGDTLDFFGDYTLSSFDLLRVFHGDGPFDPPLPVVVKHIATGGGRHILKLRALDNGKPPKKV